MTPAPPRVAFVCTSTVLAVTVPFTSSEPALTVVTPVPELVAPSVNVPAPSLVRPPAPPRLFVIAVEKPAVLMAPPPAFNRMEARLFEFTPDVSSGMFAESTRVPLLAKMSCPAPVVPAGLTPLVKP